MTLPAAIAERLGTTNVQAHVEKTRVICDAAPDAVPDLAAHLTTEEGFDFATLVVEQAGTGFDLHYFFHAHERGQTDLVQITTRSPQDQPLPAISDRVHAADWHEREAEDLFEIQFAGHPFLGDFVLHDTDWPEGVAPMRRDFDMHQRAPAGGLGEDWAPRRLLDEPGALVFPVGPVWGGYAESGLWLLETPGEEIRQVHARLFYKYRGVEKIAEDQTPESVLLLAERFSGNAAFAHALAFCQALESISATAVPARALALRTVLAELERLRYHMAVIAQLAGATALAVGKAMAQEIEEDLLRLSGEVCGHRYLFGVIAPGGLHFDLDASRIDRLRTAVPPILRRMNEFERLLNHSSSFLDRIEEMGTLDLDLAQTYGSVGPVARACGRRVDLRVQLPYAGYTTAAPPRTESEGDGYARLRMFFSEARDAGRLIDSALGSLPEGTIRANWTAAPGTALGWAEAPAGACFHWLRIDEHGRVRRWRADTPGFRNWPVFHRALEGAAFQDFPIILASFGLSVAESDR